MKIRIAVLVLLFSTAAWAQNPPPPPAPPSAAATSRASLVSRPSLEPVQQAFLASGMSSVRPVLVISYDANGVPTRLELDPPSGNTALDAAIVEWGRQVRLTPGKAGSGRLPFDLVNDELEGALPVPPELRPIPAERIALRPPLQPVVDALNAAGGTPTAYDLLVFYDGQGRVIDVSLASGARGDAVDRAVLEWARGLKLTAGAAGAGRLRVEVRGDRR